MKNRYASLITLVSIFVGPMACSDAGGVESGSRGRDAQELNASSSTRETSIGSDVPTSTGGLTFGDNPAGSETPGAGSLTIESSTTTTVMVEPAESSELVVEEPEETNHVSPSAEGELERDPELEPQTITWGDADSGVEVRLGVDAEQACAQLRDMCLANGESPATCDGLVVECEEAVAKPSEPTNSIGFVADCDELGASCRAAGGPADECDNAVAICKGADAGASQPEATIVTNCDELRASCLQAGLSDAQCDEAVAACQSPATTGDSEVGIATDCAAVLAACLSYGIAESECEDVQKECEEGGASASGNEIRLK